MIRSVDGSTLSGQAARRLERGVGRQPLADERELEQLGRACVHQGAAGKGRLSAGLPATPKRHGRAAQSGPA